MQAQEQLQPMQDTIERIYGDAQVQLGIAAPTPETGTVTPGAARVRVRHDLKLWELSANATPSEFRRWRRKYEQYYLGSDIGVTNHSRTASNDLGMRRPRTGTAPLQSHKRQHPRLHP